MAELKPCPFCGSHAVKIEHPLFECQKACCVKCYNCSCTTAIYDSETKCVKAWNRRADND